MAGDQEDTMESPAILAGQVVMATATKDDSGEGQQVIMTDSEAVVIDGSQVVMEEGSAIIDGSHVIMDSQMVMDGTQVVIKDTQEVEDDSNTGVLMEGSGAIMEEGANTGDFQPPVLQDACETVKNENEVDVKQNDLENGQYDHSNQILGLVQQDETEEVPKQSMMQVEDDLDPSQGEMLLRNLVNETFRSTASTTPSVTQHSDNIIVTTSTINTSQGSQQSLTSPTLVRGTVNNNLAVGGVSGVVSTPTRIIVQTNQGSPVKPNQGHFLIQVGGSPAVSVAQPQLVSPSNKNHIVIKAGSNQSSSQVISTSTPQAEAAESSVQPGNIFRVIIPEGTTKYTKTPSSTKVGHNEPVRKHVQINLSDGTLKKNVPMRYKSHTSQTLDRYGGEDDGKETGDKKFYECPTCNSKFMKPLYLR